VGARETRKERETAHCTLVHKEHVACRHVTCVEHARCLQLGRKTLYLSSMGPQARRDVLPRVLLFHQAPVEALAAKPQWLSWLQSIPSVRTRRSSVHSMSTSEPAIATHTHNALLPALALAGKRQGMGPRLMPGWSIQQSIRTDRMRDGSQQNGTTIHGPRMRSPPLRGHGESAVPRATRRAALLPGCRVWRLNAGPQAGY